MDQFFSPERERLLKPDCRFAIMGKYLASLVSPQCESSRHRVLAAVEGLHPHSGKSPVICLLKTFPWRRLKKGGKLNYIIALEGRRLFVNH
jgi:hypothetical protein